MRRYIQILISCCVAMLTSVSVRSQTVHRLASFSCRMYLATKTLLLCRKFAERLDPNSGTALMALSIDKGNQVGTAVGALTMENFKAGEWNKRTLFGKIDKHADKLAIGALYSGKAKFLF